MAGIICADYELVERAGETEYCIVFLGQHTHIPDRKRAVKIPREEPPLDNPAESKIPFKPDALRRIFAVMCESAARVAAAIDSATPAERPAAQRIAFVVSIRPDVERPYIVSEWVAGGCVAERITQGPLPAAEAVQIASETLEALAFAHAKGIVHGDLKPRNLLLTPEGQPRITDFGANELGPDAPPRAGSVAYFSPEQTDRDGEALDGRSDLYSLAIILYEMLTGRKMPRVLTPNLHPSKVVSGVPAALDELIIRGLQADRRARFADAAAMRVRLLEAVDGQLRPAESQEAVFVGVSPAAARSETPAPADQAEPVEETAKPEAMPEPEPGPELEKPASLARRPGEVRINEVDGAEMVWTPAGCLKMGSELAENEQPVHERPVEGFWIYKYPITQGKYLHFMRATESATPRPSSFERGDAYAGRAASGLRFEEAREYCRWVHARLPTEAEWEWAARGPRATLYPWGDKWSSGCAHTWENGSEEPTDVTRHPRGESWCGAQDMIGNVFEWCSSRFKPYPYDPQDGREDPSSAAPRVLRGGSATTPANMARATFRCAPNSQTTLTGFRPVVDDN